MPIKLKILFKVILKPQNFKADKNPATRIACCFKIYQ